jgi:phage tail sheath protein FI
MPITPTYPGIYIEELPSNAHTIAAAPTSIAVFVGYTHPFKTKPSNIGNAVEVFSFTDYEREFGGFAQSAAIDSNVAYAVNQFFLNGGTDAYVVALQATDYTDATNASVGSVAAGTATVDSIVFTALEPTDTIPINVKIDNVQGSSNEIADVTLAYGSQSETFRKVNLTSSSSDFIETRINGNSQLVTVGPGVAGPPPTYPAAFTTPPVAPTDITVTLPANTVGTFQVGDFTPVFQQDSSLDKVSIFNLLIVPGVVNNGVLSEALAFCERKQAFLIMDPPKIDVADQTTDWIGTFLDGGDSAGNIAPRSTNGAVYFPYIKSTDPSTGAAIELPPSGAVAGIYARTDTNRGVWKAPAGLEALVKNTTGVVDTGRMTDLMQGKLNVAGIDCLRTFPGVGTVVFGARTLVGQTFNTAFQQWRYVPVRRMALFLEQTLYRNLGWAVFEPNDLPLWVAIRTSIEGFMLTLFHQGAFQGATPSQAFQVKCDATTTTQQDIDNGIVNIIVAFAPLKPAEFVIIKIAQLAGQAQS